MHSCGGLRRKHIFMICGISNISYWNVACVLTGNILITIFFTLFWQQKLDLLTCPPCFKSTTFRSTPFSPFLNRNIISEVLWGKRNANYVALTVVANLKICFALLFSECDSYIVHIYFAHLLPIMVINTNYGGGLRSLSTFLVIKDIDFLCILHLLP